MKIRESGMPPEETWASFFDAETILRRLGLGPRCGDVVDFGCGYGTFTVAAAGLTPSTVHALDLEPEMVASTLAKVAAAGMQNVRARCCDFTSTGGTGLQDASVGYAMLINILHTDRPVALLGEAHRILREGGKAAIIHWNYDPSTPRGPTMDIRPRPSQCRDWLKEAGFTISILEVDLPPYHYGILAEKLIT
jgi:SAM-dependent methyltransferase